MTDMTVAIPGTESQVDTTPSAEVKPSQSDITAPQTADATPDAGKTETGEPTAAADGKQDKDKEPSQAELNRKHRNQERWARMKEKAAKYDAIIAKAEQIKKANEPDWTKFADPNEEVAERVLYSIEKKQLPLLEQEAQRVRAEAEALESQSFDDVIADARSRYPDFDDVVFNPKLPLPKQMVPYVANAERGADVAYYLGKNPDVASRLATAFQMGDAAGFMELGRIEGLLASPSKTVSTAPKPAGLIAGGSSPPGFNPDKASESEMADYLRKAGIIR